MFSKPYICCDHKMGVYVRSCSICGKLERGADIANELGERAALTKEHTEKHMSIVEFNEESTPITKAHFKARIKNDLFEDISSAQDWAAESGILENGSWPETWYSDEGMRFLTDYLYERGWHKG